MDFHIPTTETYIRALDYMQNVSLVCASNRTNKEDILLRIGLAFRDVSRGAFANDDIDDDLYAPSKLMLADYNLWEAALSKHAQDVTTAVESMISESVNLNSGSGLQVQQLHEDSPTGEGGVVPDNLASQEQHGLNKLDTDSPMDVDVVPSNDDGIVLHPEEPAPQHTSSAALPAKLSEQDTPRQPIIEHTVTHDASNNGDAHTEPVINAEPVVNAGSVINTDEVPSTSAQKSGRKRRLVDKDEQPQLELVIQTRQQKRVAENSAASTSGSTRRGGVRRGSSHKGARGGSGKRPSH
ncbi:hypothetical protein BDY19DRAFT_996405 [Irpex rosettiformis]|uniref:Uncharacterized protein n=1 Tax=Irpex rosettiformis TaxID=378272 RepID=A0ACB8TVD4_9APHY|nr:hypothetical protein BDY19DRAFT_996405 [Irpex rosettiformis]